MGTSHDMGVFMIIDMKSITRITNNGEFTSIELLNGDVIHTLPTAEQKYNSSISICRYTDTSNDETFFGLSIDITTD